MTSYIGAILRKPCRHPLTQGYRGQLLIGIFLSLLSLVIFASPSPQHSLITSHSLTTNTGDANINLANTNKNSNQLISSNPTLNQSDVSSAPNHDLFTITLPNYIIATLLFTIIIVIIFFLRWIKRLSYEINLRKSIERQLNDNSFRLILEKQRSDLHFQQTELGMIEWDTDCKVIKWNPAAEKIFGYTKQDIIGKQPYGLILPEDVTETYKTLWQERLSIHLTTHETCTNITKAHQSIICEWHSTPLIDSNGAIISISSFVTDITEQKQLEQVLWQQANFDSLTELPNRNLLYHEIDNAIINAERNQQLLGVLFIDLDNFKKANDQFGHEIGDQLLREASQRLRQCVRKSDIVGRLSGDEFIAVLPAIIDPSDCTDIANKMLSALEKPYTLHTQIYSEITASIGIAFYPNDATTTTQLIKQADIAMYQAKSNGRNQLSTANT